MLILLFNPCCFRIVLFYTSISSVNDMFVRTPIDTKTDYPIRQKEWGELDFITKPYMEILFLQQVRRQHLSTL